jgi:hypothetical protein
LGITLTLPDPDMVSKTQQNSTNPWICWVFSLASTKPGYGQ